MKRWRAVVTAMVPDRNTTHYAAQAVQEVLGTLGCEDAEVEYTAGGQRYNYPHAHPDLSEILPRSLFASGVAYKEAKTAKLTPLDFRGDKPSGATGFTADDVRAYVRRRDG